MNRPTIAGVKSLCEKWAELNISFECPPTVRGGGAQGKQRDKGGVGKLFERLAGIPTSSACLDCLDGEVKVFPVTYSKAGYKNASKAEHQQRTMSSEFRTREHEKVLKPKETVKITCLNNTKLLNQTFHASDCCTKLTNTLFVPYKRVNQDGENDAKGERVVFLKPTLFTLTSRPTIENALREDYDLIRESLMNNQTLEGSSKLGTYLQNRTHGAGGNAPKTRAFYLRPAFIHSNVAMCDSAPFRPVTRGHIIQVRKRKTK